MVFSNLRSEDVCLYELNETYTVHEVSGLGGMRLGCCLLSIV